MYQNLDMEEMEGRKNGTLIIISLNNPRPNSNPILLFYLPVVQMCMNNITYRKYRQLQPILRAQGKERWNFC